MRLAFRSLPESQRMQNREPDLSCALAWCAVSDNDRKNHLRLHRGFQNCKAPHAQHYTDNSTPRGLLARRSSVKVYCSVVVVCVFSSALPRIELHKLAQIRSDRLLSGLVVLLQHWYLYGVFNVSDYKKNTRKQIRTHTHTKTSRRRCVDARNHRTNDD